MGGTLLQDSTGKTQLEEPAEFYLYSAASEPRSIEWTGQKAVRWPPFSDPGRVRNLPWTFVSQVTSAGFYDVVTLSLRPDALIEAFFRLYYPTVGDWKAQDVFRRTVEGPSPLGGPSENATVHEVEDPAFSKEFIEYFRPSLAQISQLSGLSEGWDSYGANRIAPEAIGRATQLLRFLHSSGRTIPLPVIGPSPSGGVVLQWFQPNIEIYAEIGPDAYEYYVAHPGEDNVLQEGAGDEPKDLVSTLLNFLR